MIWEELLSVDRELIGLCLCLLLLMLLLALERQHFKRRWESVWMEIRERQSAQDSRLAAFDLRLRKLEQVSEAQVSDEKWRHEEDVVELLQSLLATSEAIRGQPVLAENEESERGEGQMAKQPDEQEEPVAMEDLA